MRWFKYLWHAFNARPFRMPVPPLWFAAILTGLLGYFINPALYWAGSAALILFTGIVASNRRFQNLVEATQGESGDEAKDDERQQLLKRLDRESGERQARLEQQCQELERVLAGAKAGDEHIRGVWQLAQLHLRLLVTRNAAADVLDRSGGDALSKQIAKLNQRSAQPDNDPDLREALEDQRQVVEKRLAMQQEAKRRQQLLDAELDRIQEQIALIREQALLTTDPAGIRRSVDSLSTFLNESGRWLQEQEAIFGNMDSFDLGSATFSSTPDSTRRERESGGQRMGESQ